MGPKSQVSGLLKTRKEIFMNANSFVLKKFTAQTGLIRYGASAPKDYISYAIETDTDAEELATFHTEKEAREALKRYDGQGGCIRREGINGGFYEATAYAVECYEADEDGEFIEGSDYIF